MFLKSLVLRGFKSFAERTTLEFSPGVSIIVGPNGSGKSNLVDAIAWVLGEQGPKTLRGGRMEDVIFAGTPGRPALGRAEVSLTIDNSSGALPIEFTEVTISRTLFRTGESEYAINGSPCRLLDIQELLSDSGIGRELHTVVGQGQLDAILSGRPEERRAAIEEAAGILKYRKRRERAGRKLERVEAGIERLGDIITELRRQIRPLERQAELAKRAQAIEEELRDARLRLWVLDYRSLMASDDVEEERRAAAEMERCSREAEAAGVDVETVEETLAAARRDADRESLLDARIASLLERVRGLRGLAEERARHLADLARRAPRSETPSPEELERARRAREEARAARAAAEEAARLAEERVREAAVRREEATRRREEITQRMSERAALRASIEAAVGERQRLEEQRGALRDAGEQLGGDADAIRAEMNDFDERETALVRRIEEHRQRHEAERETARRLDRQVRTLERETDALDARREILAEQASRIPDPAAPVEGLAGTIGRLAEFLEIRPGYEAAVRAALEPHADAVLVSARGDAVAALQHLKKTGARAALIVASGVESPAPLPPDVRSLLDVAIPSGPAAEAVRRLLGSVALAETLDEAAALTRAAPGLTAVTREGDRIGPGTASGGAPVDARDLHREQAAVEEQLDERRRALAEAVRAADHARAAADMVAREVQGLEASLDELDARITALADRLGQIERDRHAAEREDAILAGRVGELSDRLGGEERRLAAVEEELATATAAAVPVDLGEVAEGERLAAERARALGEATERERSLGARLAEFEERVRRAAEERAAWEAGRQAWLEGAATAARVAATAERAVERLERWAAEARIARDDRARRLEALEEQIAVARRRRRECEAALEEARERAHTTDLRRAEREHRVAAMVERLGEETGMRPEEALESVSVTADEADELRRRAAACERRLSLLGRVNPIAMEQHQGLVDRHAFLSEQVDDLKRSRRDLLDVIREVDGKIQEVFGAAFEDVAREFSVTFARLFPGGEGRLTLTEPADLLETGVEVEARPAGKRLKRISLLSGGERSLTATALLYAIFRARPSPFYLLDEVEAALDDINLHRFLDLTVEFRDRSQILIVTHQKRTMEIADVLYGISMTRDGVTRVISERLEERRHVDA